MRKRKKILVTIIILLAISTILFFLFFKQIRKPLRRSTLKVYYSLYHPPKEYSTILPDSDGDGLEDNLEKEIGSDPYKIDTDNDGLTDYEEYCKYKTFPNKADSDGDGKIDSLPEEKREFTYTLKLLFKLAKPYDIETMNDLYQAARLIREEENGQGLVEIIVYPYARHHLLPTRLDEIKDNDEIRQYLKKSYFINYSKEMQNELREILKSKNCQTDLEAVDVLPLWVSTFTHQSKYKNGDFPWLDIQFIGGKPIWKKKNQELDKIKDSKYLNLFCFGDSMFKNRSHGSCSSIATLKATIFRVVGIPTRICFSLPIINHHDPEHKKLIERVSNPEIKEILIKSFTFDDHFYNEVYINKHWVDQDVFWINSGTIFNRAIFIGLHSYIITRLKTISFGKWEEVDFTNWDLSWCLFLKSSKKSLEIRKKAYNLIDLKEQYPINESKSEYSTR